MVGTALPESRVTLAAEAMVSLSWPHSTTPKGPEPLSPLAALPGTGGAGVGTGAAGANVTAGASGIGLLLALATVDGKTRSDVKAIVTPSVLTTAPLLGSPTIYHYDDAPVRFIGGPKEVKTYGALTYYQSGLQTGNAGWNGPSGGGGFWIMEYVTDAPVHEIRLRKRQRQDASQGGLEVRQRHYCPDLHGRRGAVVPGELREVPALPALRVAAEP